MNPVEPELPVTYYPLFAVVAIWLLTIKGLALYRAGAQRQKGWFVALFVINTFGILELVYLLAISKRRR
jgi:methionyl-tRNA synthetase